MKKNKKVFLGLGIILLGFMQMSNADITHTFTNDTTDTITIKIDGMVKVGPGGIENDVTRKLNLKPNEKNKIEYKAKKIMAQLRNPSVFLTKIVITGPRGSYVVYDFPKISKMLNEPILGSGSQSFNIIYTSDQKYALQTKKALYKPIN